MKTYVFEGWWEDAWECGDGCCSGGGEYHINFVHLLVDGVEDKSYYYKGGTNYWPGDVYISVYEDVFDTNVSDDVYEMSPWEQTKLLKEELKKVGVDVIIYIAEMEWE